MSTIDCRRWIAIHRCCNRTLISCAVFAFALAYSPQAVRSGSIDSKQLAIESAYRFITAPGRQLSLATSQRITAEVETYNDSTTPFLTDTVQARRVWNVTFDRIVLELDSCPNAISSEYPRTLTLYIDSASGRLFYVESRLIDTLDSGHSTNIVLSAEAEHQMGGERWLSFPIVPPKVTFFVALRKAIGSKLTAHLITGHYTNAILGDSLTDRAVWSIHLMEFPPIFHGQTNMRSVIDANTGALIYSCNLPRPKSKGPK